MCKNIKPKVLFVTPLPPPVHGSSMVSQSIKESRVLNKTFDMNFVNLSTSRKVEEIDKRSWKLYAKKAVRFMGAYAKTFGLLTMRRYDLCYLAITCHGVGFLKDAPFVLLCKLFGRKVVIHQHNKGMAKDVNRPVYRWLLPLVYKNTKVILLSWRLYPDIEKVVKKEQVIICPNGIPDTNNKEPLADRNNEIPRILFLSNLIVSKGVLVLLDALKILKERGCRFVCDFVGGESKEVDAKRFLREVETRGLNGVAIYHGKRYREEKMVFFEKADIFTQPTYDDCFPLTLLEAMQQKLPIVSTEVGAIPDEISNGKTGYISKEKDANDLAEKLTILIENPKLRQNMGEEGYKRYKAMFTQQVFENTMSDSLLKVIYP